MATNDLMNDFPPTRDAQVSLSNWRKAPFSQWGFRNIRRLLPTANIAGAARPVPFETESREVWHTRFSGPNGHPTTIAAALPATQTDALVVLRRGRIAAEWYGTGMGASTPHIVFSVSKSICGTLGGILVERRQLDPEHLVTEYVPELAESVYGGDCTVRHLLDMAVGISFTEDYVDPKSNVVRYRQATGWDPLPAGAAPIDLRGFLAQQQPDGNAHGSLFHYVSTNTDVLGWVYERACDRPYADILSDYLWAPMGAEHDAYITVDAHDAMRAAGGICATPRDLARFGELIRRRGVADGRQVVPGRWIDDINQQGDAEIWARGEFAELFPNASYRSKWYRVDRDRNVLIAYGIHGQFIYINPDAELVIVRMACEDTPVDAEVARSWRRGFDAIAQQFM
ncbi:MAG: serine hydrolase [Tardiphaga sp.]|nr:serine hydrolase [Tardiphaga sp.]